MIKIIPGYQMANPPHIGEIIADLYLDAYKLSITKFAEILGVNRTYISKLINGKVGLSPAMALRMHEAFGTPVKLFLDMQQAYDVWEARQTTSLTKVKKFEIPLSQNYELA